jgi:hypothetical protein
VIIGLHVVVCMQAELPVGRFQQISVRAPGISSSFNSWKTRPPKDPLTKKRKMMMTITLFVQLVAISRLAMNDID